MHPTLSELIALEKKTFSTIISVSEFSHIDGFIKGAQNATRQGGNASRPLNRLEASFHLKIDIGLRSDRGKPPVKRFVEIGMVVTGDITKDEVSATSYAFLLLAEDNPRSAVMRKFHIDYENPLSRNHLEPKPSHHLQICGKASPKMRTLNPDIEEALTPHFPSIEKPRIHSQPTCLALILDWMFSEFQVSATIQKIQHNQVWTNHIHEAEKVILKPYYNAIASHFATSGSTTSIACKPYTRSIAYGNP
jgi:hypothetical protein